MPASAPMRPETARNLRWVCNGLVARFKRTFIPSFPLDSLPGCEASVSMHHPTDQTIRFAVRQRPRLMGYPAVGNRGMQKRTHIAVKLGFQRRNKIRESRTQAGHAHGSDTFAPSVLVIRGHGINLIQQHLWRNVAAVHWKVRAAEAAEHAAAHDDGGQR